MVMSTFFISQPPYSQCCQDKFSPPPLTYPVASAASFRTVTGGHTNMNDHTQEELAPISWIDGIYMEFKGRDQIFSDHYREFCELYAKFSPPPPSGAGFHTVTGEENAPLSWLDTIYVKNYGDRIFSEHYNVTYEWLTQLGESQDTPMPMSNMIQLRRQLVNYTDEEFDHTVCLLHEAGKIRRSLLAGHQSVTEVSANSQASIDVCFELMAGMNIGDDNGSTDNNSKPMGAMGQEGRE